MSSYQTQQRAALLDYLHRHADEAFTAADLSRGMRLDPEVPVAPGVSTVYRLLTKLTQEGSIRRFVQEEGRQYLYQALACGRGEGHLHLKCSQCGRFIHMGEDQSSRILRNISQELRFQVDEEQTVLVGHCAQCEGEKTP